MHLEIVTPEKTLFNGEVESVKLPGAGGKFEVLNNHAPLISSLEAGVITVKTGSETETFEVTGGIVEVLQNKIVILA